MERTILHIVGGQSRSRAEQARIAFALGHHAEIYGDLDELLLKPPRSGLVMAADSIEAGGGAGIIRILRDHGVGLPVVITANEPHASDIVSAIKAGALDYLGLPLEMGDFARRLSRIQAEAEQLAETYRFEIEARQLLSKLSGRQLEVLRLLSEGCSNKEIARVLGISPRTVEIHRANMMAKLRANHAADAVRLWLAALPSPVSSEQDTLELAGRQREGEASLTIMPDNNPYAAPARSVSGNSSYHR
ncbi:RNA polymerase sigma factor (sigma-70 family) [Altererythrobacter atlanticus]|uniref:Transcriptional regulatory protein FixJ n=1 Tax=Croceibacterium atlanticum TaxID=1267766 RepID=A0A0F7KV99_9SPHN|nr:LuxR C-terminal-related transcriptional regulator [Croceibacterium atlanticum]AKH44268.1 Transcriptional regulatory protein FixJ [Croceibacterium atlanticum]MBB5732579.1 RNA polymerase sigma factor (sigma-70 family) [Croceibacterium atlanticum]